MASNFDDFNLSDVLSGPTASILLPLIGAVGGALRPIPTRFGVRRAGFSGALEGALPGFNLVSQMQGQRRALGEQRRLSELLGDKGFFAEEIPTGKQRISGIVPKTETDVGATEEESFAFKPEFTPETAPRMAPERRRMLAALPPSVQASTLGSILARAPEKPQIFGTGETGFSALDATGRLRQLQAGLGRRRTVATKDLGNEVVTYYTDTGEEISRTPKGAAPEKPGEAEKRAAETERARAQAARARQAVETARDPSKATVGQLASGIQSLTRAAEFAEDDSEADVMRDARHVLIEELAARRKNRPTDAPASTEAPGVKAGDIGGGTPRRRSLGSIFGGR